MWISVDQTPAVTMACVRTELMTLFVSVNLDIQERNVPEVSQLVRTSTELAMKISIVPSHSKLIIIRTYYRYYVHICFKIIRILLLWLLFVGCKAESDVAFIVDTSSYMGEKNFGKVKRFMRNIVQKLALYNDQSRVAVVTFSGMPTVERYLSEPTTKEDVMGAINALHYDGNYPFIADALDVVAEDVFTVEKGDRPFAQNYAIVITGGVLFSQFETPLKHNPRDEGIHVFGIGVGLNKKNADQLNMIVSNPEAAFLEQDPDRLNTIVDSLVGVLCEGE